MDSKRLENLLPDEWQEPRRGCGTDRPVDVSVVIDGEESDSLRLERPPLAIDSRRGSQGHRDPNVIGCDLVRNPLANCLITSMALHLNPCKTSFHGSAQID